MVHKIQHGVYDTTGPYKHRAVLIWQVRVSDVDFHKDSESGLSSKITFGTKESFSQTTVELISNGVSKFNHKHKPLSVTVTDATAVPGSAFSSTVA